ncbi:gp22 [Burkholderia phage BcepB1A]|uniref:gp22 n=1 Tax=Burkholderia phage BcepB1A TaxID=279530 RepID=UPI0000377993|nr:gp22 [Burkholderia phage BcepB1A]AAT37728.1 gp22 [Burkholderia phage BcepB1A]
MDNSIFDGPKTVHVYSTLANSQQYPLYERDPQGNAHILAHVHINGGAGLANKHLITPIGVMTAISEKALEHLEQSHVFQKHVERGFITVRKDQVDIERAVAEHTSERDPSAPIVPEDYQQDAERAEEDPDAAVALPQGVKNSRKRK